MKYDKYMESYSGGLCGNTGNDTKFQRHLRNWEAKRTNTLPGVHV